MAKEIKQKITLEGEKEYNAAIKEAQRNLKTLRSELKAETAELGRNATEQQKAETRRKNLQKSIKEQEKIVKTYTKALEEVREKYGDNEDEVQKWEQKLNNARATLAGMKNDLDGLGEGFKKAERDAQMGTVAAKSFADSIGKIADAGEAVSSGIENLFRGMVDTVRSAISEVWADMVDLAGRANSWVDLAGFWNTDAATIQKWTHAVEGAHNSFDDLNNAVTRINMGDQKKIAAATLVSGEEFSDKWKYAMAVMDSMAAMNYEDRLNAAGEVFGEKRATKVMDLLNDWGTIRDNLAHFEGLGMTEEQIGEMSSLAERIDLLHETWKAFLDSFEATHMGRLSLDLVGGAQTILEDLIKYLDSGDDADLEQLEKDIDAFFTRIVQAIEGAATKLDEAGKKLEQSDNGIVRTIGKAMQDLAGALQWISEEGNIDKVIAGFEVLAAFWLIGKGASLIAKIAEFAANLKVMQAFNAAGAAAGAAGAASGTAGSIGASIASALSNVVLPVALSAILCYPILDELINGRARREQAQQHADEVNKVVEESGLKPTGEMKKDAGRAVLEYIFTGKTPSYDKYKTSGETVEEAIDALAGAPTVNVSGSGPSSPVRTARMDATAAQQAAAEALWDAWRDGDMDGFDSAWDALQAAFEGNEATLERLDGWLDRLMEEYNSAEQDKDFNPANWMDIPASWWKTPAGGTDTGDNITGSDLRTFRGLPASMQSAVQRGAAAGVAGIQVRLDGRAVGEMVAPYVSTIIARDIV